MSAERARELIEQLAFIDHEESTDIAGHLTALISQAKLDGLTATETVELLKNQAKLMQLNSVLVDDEHYQLVQDLIQNISDVLFA